MDWFAREAKGACERMLATSLSFFFFFLVSTLFPLKCCGHDGKVPIWGWIWEQGL